MAVQQTERTATRAAPKRTARRATTLTELLTKGQKSGHLDARQIEASILHKVPDASEFSLFLDLTRTLGITIRDRLPAPAPTPASLRALNIYFRDVGRHRLLTADEERAVARLAREGDERARELMVLSNLRLVVSMARKFAGKGLDLEDLIEEGNLGLITAVQRYDPEKGFRFSTYAAWWIRLGMAKGLSEQSRTLKIPLHVMRSLHRYIETERKLALDLGRFPHADEVAREAGFGPRRARNVTTLVRGIKSLDEVAVGEAGRGLTLLERIPDTPCLEDVIHRQMECRHLEDLMNRLSERENLVLRIRYGLMDGTPRSLTRTGMFLGVSRERVRQIERRALRRLREWIETEERRGAELLERMGSCPNLA